MSSSGVHVLKREKHKRTMEITDWVLLQVGTSPIPIETVHERDSDKAPSRNILPIIKKLLNEKTTFVRQNRESTHETMSTKAVQSYTVYVNSRVTMNSIILLQLEVLRCFALIFYLKSALAH